MPLAITAGLSSILKNKLLDSYMATPPLAISQQHSFHRIIVVCP